jgi:hypothetical protein
MRFPVSNGRGRGEELTLCYLMPEL